MAIYMQAPGIKGNVTAVDHKDWIELESFNFGTERLIVTQPGNVYDRVRSSPLTTDMIVIKRLDQTSPQFFSQACVGGAIPEININVCQTANHYNPYLQYSLKNVLLSEYGILAETEKFPIEWLALNFTEIEKRYITHNEKQQPAGATSVQLKQASTGCLYDNYSSIALIRRQLKIGSVCADNDFLFFVATVYGEAGGASEAAYQAVASVIMNRVNNSIWAKHHWNATPRSIIRHTGFDGRNDKQHSKVSAYFNHRSYRHHFPALNKFERKKMEKMIELLAPIYYKKMVTTDATYFYSPKAQKKSHQANPAHYKEVPSFASQSNMKQVKIKGLLPTDDFVFYKQEK